MLADARAALVVDRPDEVDAAQRRTARAREADPGRRRSRVIHTSGTTGAPKPVELTYGNFHASALGERREPRRRAGRPLAVLHAAVPRRRPVDPHALARSTGPRRSIHDGFDAERGAARARGASAITLVSLVADACCAGCSTPGSRRRPSCAPRCSAAARCRADLLERARERRRPGAPDLRHDRDLLAGLRPPAGRCPGAEIDAIGADGEILVRGPMVAPGALADDGWLHTGDRGRIDDGRLPPRGGPHRRHDRHRRRERVGGRGRGGAARAPGRRGRRRRRARRTRSGGRRCVAFVVGDVGDADELDAHLPRAPRRLQGPEGDRARRRELPRNAAGQARCADRLAQNSVAGRYGNSPG